MPKTDTQATPKAPEITIPGLIDNAKNGVEQGKAILYKQIGVQEFLESLEKEGYELVKKEKDG